MLLQVEVIRITEEIGQGLGIETDIRMTPEGEIGSRIDSKIVSRTEATRGSRIRAGEMQGETPGETTGVTTGESIEMQTEGKCRV
jgi:hypothetical protein